MKPVQWFNEDQYQLHELKDYYYYVQVNINEILVFVDETSFYFINGDKEKNIKLNKIKNGKSYLKRFLSNHSHTNECKNTLFFPLEPVSFRVI